MASPRQYEALWGFIGHVAGEKAVRDVAAGEVVRLTDKQAETLGPDVVSLYVPEFPDAKPAKKPKKKKTQPRKGA